MNDVELAIHLTADADEAVKAADRVGDSYGRMASDVDDATKKADTASGRMDSAAESADHMASKSSQAAGGMGDLGGALSGLPGPLGAVGAGMESVAPAIMGVTGAADLLNLVMESTILVQARERAAAIAQAVTSKATAAATKAWAATQWVLNAAMAASPVLLIVAGVAALVAVVILAYRHSERFRRIVDAAFRAVQRAAAAALGWIRDNWKNILAILTGPVGIAVRLVTANWDRIKTAFFDAFEAMRDKARAALEWVRDKVAWLRDRVGDVAGAIEDKLVDAFDAVKAPVQWLVDKVEWLIDKLGSLELPDLPGFLGGRAIAGGRSPVSTTVTSSGPMITNNFYLSGVLDGADAARKIQDVLSRYGMQTGIVVA